MSQSTSGLPMQSGPIPVRIPSASGVLGTSSAAILAAAGPSHFDTTIGRGRERKGSDASESSGTSSRVKTRCPTRGISANLSNSDDSDSDADSNPHHKPSQAIPSLELPGREVSPPTDRPLIRQAVAFQSVQPAVINISTYEASPVAPQTKKKSVFLPGQAPAGTGKKSRGRRGAASTADAREALQAQQNGEALAQPGPTVTDGTTATGRTRKQGAYPGQARFRLSEMAADTTPRPSRQRKNAAGSIASATTPTTSTKTTPSSGLIYTPLKPGKGKERDTSIMNGGLGRMRLKTGHQTAHASSSASDTNRVDNYPPAGYVHADAGLRLNHEMSSQHTRSYSGSSTGPLIPASGSSTNHIAPHKPPSSYYRRDYDSGAEILDLTEQRDSETPPPPLLMPASTAPSPSVRSSNDTHTRSRASQPSSHPYDGHRDSRKLKVVADDNRLPHPASSHSGNASPRTISYPPASPPPLSQPLPGGGKPRSEMDNSPPSSPGPNSPELQIRGKPRTVTVYISDFRTGQLDEQLVEVKLSLAPCSSPQEGFWADANDLCQSIQSSPSRIDGPAKAFTMRGSARQIILRVSRSNVDEFMHAKVLVQKDRSINLTVELLQPVGSLPLPPPRPTSPYGGRYDIYDRHSDRMDVDPRRYGHGPSPNSRYYHRKRPSSPSFDNFDGYSNQPSSSQYSSNKAPRNDYNWDMAPRRPPSDYHGPRSPSPRYGARDDPMDVDHSSRRRHGAQHGYPSPRESNHRSRDAVYAPRNRATTRPRIRQYLTHRSHTPSREASPEPLETFRRYPVSGMHNPNEQRRGHLTPDPMNGSRRSASPAESSDGGSSLDEADPFMGSIIKILQQDRKLWDEFYAESTWSLPPAQHLIKKYDILQKLLQKYSATKVPGYEVLMEEKYILQIMWSSFRSKRGRARLMDELKEAIGLVELYGPNGTRKEVAEVVRLLSEGNPAKTFDQLAVVRKNLLATLRRVHQEWENRHQNLEMRDHQHSQEDLSRPTSSQSIVLQADGTANAGDSDPVKSAGPISLSS